MTKAEGLPLVAAVLLCLLAMRKPTATSLVAPSIVLAAWLPLVRFYSEAWDRLLYGQRTDGDGAPPWERAKSPVAGRLDNGIDDFSPLRWGLLVPACLITALIARRLDARLGLTTVLQLLLFVVVYDVAGSHQGGGLDDFMAKNVDRILITPLGILALSVGLGSREASSSAGATPQV